MKFAVLKYMQRIKSYKAADQYLDVLFIPEISVVLCEIVYLFMKIFEKTKVIASHDNFCEKQIRTFDILFCFNQR